MVLFLEPEPEPEPDMGGIGAAQATQQEVSIKEQIRTIQRKIEEKESTINLLESEGVNVSSIEAELASLKTILSLLSEHAGGGKKKKSKKRKSKKRKSKRKNKKKKSKKSKKLGGGNNKINILFVPGIEGIWRKNDPKYPFHGKLWSTLEKTMNIYTPYNHNKSQERQKCIYNSIYKYNCNYVLGYSVGACRLLKCYEENKFENVNTLILISPSFSTNDLGVLNISKVIPNLKNTRVILIDTDKGYAGSDNQYQWTERNKLKESINNTFARGSEIIFLEGTDHMITDNNLAEKAVQIIQSKL